MFKPNALLNAAKKAATFKITAPTTIAIASRVTVPAAYRFYASKSYGEIANRVIDTLQGFDKVDQNKLTEDAHFVKDLGLDSLDTVEVIMAIEEEFSIEIPDNEADEIKTVKDAIEYVGKREDAH